MHYGHDGGNHNDNVHNLLTQVKQGDSGQQSKPAGLINLL